MTLYRGTVLDTPGRLLDPAGLRAEEDCGLLVTDGVITARGPFADLRAAHPGVDVVDLRGGVVLPGLVDTHVHYPQVRVIGGLGLPLLDWLRECALPEEARLADAGYARGVARDFLTGLVRAGTTTALVFGSHFPEAVDVLLGEAEAVGLRLTTGLVVSDRGLRPDLLRSPDAAHAAGQDLVDRWHGRGRLRYAVTPRFSLSTTEAMLEACAALLANDGVLFTTHLNENTAEVAEVRRLFPDARDYLDTYARHGLVTDRSVFAHNVHPTPAELAVLAGSGAGVAHCPSSNCSLGSGLFPLRAHLDAGVHVALGSDVGAGTGFSLLKDGLQAYFVQRLLGPAGVPLAPADLLHLATRSGALALDLADTVGDLSVGKDFDALWLRPTAGSTLEVALRHPKDAADVVAKIFTLGTPADVDRVWVAGRQVRGPAPAPEPEPADPSLTPLEA
ncbi:guanine deaminase [Georgenia sp. TF02-10]|uniref:guanine deaminase n=1 Tax=Georgenia sp. TF02-10 TaxID=2917725 RepID=UPI001FA80FF9|nr:guanine deaminase [Georgenia sp. TF02-10]UNX53688.1 guanine deaminase [Georgenia sp. TF02-10]